MCVTLSPAQLLCAFAICLAFAVLFFALGVVAERDRRERAERESARLERLERARAHREVTGMLGERGWFADVVETERRRGVRRVKLETKGVA